MNDTNEFATIIARIGRMLFGREWIDRLADDLDVNERTIRRWTAAPTEIPDGVRGEMLEMIDQRIAQLEQAKIELISPS